MASETKHCGHCDRDLPPEAFAKKGEGLQSWCRACMSDYRAERAEATSEARRLRRLAEGNRIRAQERASRARRDPGVLRHYGRQARGRTTLTQAEIEEMAERQEHRCAICGRHERDSYNGLHADHNHVTGKSRELLCNKCNLALGLLDDNIETMETALAYLRRHAV